MPTQLNAPVAARKPHAVPSPHGARQDPYYWLRDDTRKSPDVIAYLEAENAYKDAVLAPTRPLQDQLYAEIVGRLPGLTKRGGGGVLRPELYADLESSHSSPKAFVWGQRYRSLQPAAPSGTTGTTPSR